MSGIGLLLVLVGATLVVAEAHVPSHGALGTAAAVALAAGIGLLVSGAGLGRGRRARRDARHRAVLARARAADRAQGPGRRAGIRARGGAEGLVGPARRGARRARAGRPRVRGRRAVAGAPVGPEGEPELQPGDPVVIEQVSGLTLTVRPAEEWEVAP